MNKGDTVYVILRNKVRVGELGNKTTAQGFYTRWGEGHTILERSSPTCALARDYNNEDIFSTKRAAVKELFTRRLRYPQFFQGAA